MSAQVHNLTQQSRLVLSWRSALGPPRAGKRTGKRTNRLQADARSIPFPMTTLLQRACLVSKNLPQKIVLRNHGFLRACPLRATARCARGRKNGRPLPDWRQNSSHLVGLGGVPARPRVRAARAARAAERSSAAKRWGQKASSRLLGGTKATGRARAARSTVELERESPFRCARRPSFRDRSPASGPYRYGASKTGSCSSVIVWAIALRSVT